MVAPKLSQTIHSLLGGLSSGWGLLTALLASERNAPRGWADDDQAIGPRTILASGPA